MDDGAGKIGKVSGDRAIDERNGDFRPALAAFHQVWESNELQRTHRHPPAAGSAQKLIHAWATRNPVTKGCQSLLSGIVAHPTSPGPRSFDEGDSLGLC